MFCILLHRQVVLALLGINVFLMGDLNALKHCFFAVKTVVIFLKDIFEFMFNTA